MTFLAAYRTSLLILMGSFLVCTFSFGQTVSPFSARYQTTAKGNIVFVSNTILECNGVGGGGADCGNLATQAPPTFEDYSQNNDHVVEYIDIDADATTFSSSSDMLDLPTCSTILFAGIYWGGQSDDGDLGYPDRNSIKIDVNGGGYETVVADELIDAGSAEGLGLDVFYCFADITELVQENPTTAEYTVADLYSRLQTATNRWGGWNIVVVYENETLPVRTLNVFDGLVNIENSGVEVNVDVTGFSTPAAGPVEFEVGVYAYDGDRGFTGDSLLFDGGAGFVPISNSLNPIGDIFNSSQTNADVVTMSQVPLKLNTISTDADIFRPDNSGFGYIGNSQTTASIKVNTSNETVQIQVVTLALDVAEPALSASMTVEDINGGLLEPDDILEYRIKAKNNGSDNSLNTFVIDTLPSILEFVPGSIEIVHGPNIGIKTDGVGDDQGEYNAVHHVVKLNIGDGADGAVGGLVENSAEGIDSTVFVFRARVKNDCVHILCDNSVFNLATVYGTGELSGNSISGESVEGSTDLDGCIIPGATFISINDLDCELRPDTIIEEFCTGGDPADFTYDEDGYGYFNDIFIPLDEVTGPGDIFAIYTPFEGCSDTIIITVEAVSEIPSMADAGPDQEACEDDPTSTLEGVETDVGDGEWTLFEGAGTITDPTDENTTVTTLDVGENIFVWTVVNGSCLSTTDTMVVNVLNLPSIASAGDDLVLCAADGSASLNGNIPVIGVGEWTVTIGSGVIDDADDPLTGVSSMDLGENTFTWTISNGVCPASSDEVTIIQESDPDFDGICFSSDLDNDNDGIPDINESGDSDGDGVDDLLDLDSDNDGIPDIVEAGGVDDNGDGRVDGFLDTNLDGLNDAFLVDPLPNPDSDGDGLRDTKDLDSDNDGVVDIVEAQGVDTDSNGRVDDTSDVDADGLADLVDTNDDTILGEGDGIGIPWENPDRDEDGVDDRIDVDEDNDGISGLFENTGVDDAMDGRLDGFTDADGDGIDASVDPDEGGLPFIMADVDRDGVVNSHDLDSDNDGLADLLEAGGVDDNGDGKIDSFSDVDGDGFSDLVDTDNDNIDGTGDGGDALPMPDTDEMGQPDFLDIDADGDGIVDNVEVQTSFIFVAPVPGDVDGDGLLDVYDIEGGGTPLTPIDIDNDGIPDYLDLDSDGDGELDSNEGHDLDGDGAPDFVPDLNDADNDGLDDAYDSIDLTDGTSTINAANGSSDPITDNIYADANNPGIGDLDFREVDSDGDGVLDIFDLDDDNDGIPDLVEDTDEDGDGDPTTNPTDTDGDGIPDILDLDSDNDGIPDIVEAGGEDENMDGRVDDLDEDGFLVSDTDGDGLDDRYDSDNGGEDIPNPDTDGDGNPDFQDIDSDEDGIYDIVEDGGEDLDDDGLVDDWSDEDNNGWDESNGTDGSVDTDGDGTPDFQDTDSDNDTVLDSDENDSNEDGDGLDDTDGDNIPDYKDTDDDGDAIPTIEEAVIESNGEYKDCDGDDIPDYLDPDPCNLFVPSAFTPDGDGINDLFVIRGIDAYPAANLIIFNRWGDKVYEAVGGYPNDWDGANYFMQIGDPKELPEATYYYILDLGEGDPMKGFIYLKR